jgi:Flp pilus assembly protein TadD
MLKFAKRNVIVSVYSVLILSTLLVFWQVRNFDFVNYDDDRYVYENPHVLNGLTPDGIIWAFTTGSVSNWHPITWLSLMLDCQLFGKNPGWMHLINLLLHLVNTLLLFAVLKKMTSSLWPSAFVAAAFALHPMHVESFAWIAERKDVLSTLFWMLTLLAYAGYVKRPTILRYLVTITIFAVGLMTKPMLVTLPFVLLLLDYWPMNRFDSQPAETSGRWHRIMIEKIPFFVLTAISSVITFFVQRSGGAVTYFRVLPLHSRVANAFLSYAKYIGKMFWPQDLAVFYPFDVRTIQFWQVVLCALLIVVVSVLAIRFGRKQKYLFVGWFWFVGTLIPVIGLVQVGQQSLADRYTYISYIGLFIIIGWGLPKLFSKWPQRKIALGLSMVIVLTTLGICAHQQVSFWNNSVTLFSHAVKVTRNNYLAYDSLGVAFNSLGRYQDAIEAYKQAIRIKPDYAEAYYNLGVVCDKLGRYQDAVESYKQAIKIKPHYAKAYINLGVACNKLGRYQDAVETYKQVMQIKPDYADAYINLGVTYYKLGRYQDAVESYKQAIRIKPDYALAHYNVGIACDKLGRYEDAVKAYKQAIRIKPDYIKAHYNLGLDYLTVGDKGSALEEYKILKTLDTKQANKFFNLINK